MAGAAQVIARARVTLALEREILGTLRRWVRHSAAGFHHRLEPASTPRLGPARSCVAGARASRTVHPTPSSRPVLPNAATAFRKSRSAEAGRGNTQHTGRHGSLGGAHEGLLPDDHSHTDHRDSDRPSLLLERHADRARGSWTGWPASDPWATPQGIPSREGQPRTRSRSGGSWSVTTWLW